MGSHTAVVPMRPRLLWEVPSWKVSLGYILPPTPSQNTTETEWDPSSAHCLPFLPQKNRCLAPGQTPTEFALLSLHLSFLWLILEIWSWPLTFSCLAFAPFRSLLLFLICWMSFVCKVSFPIIVGIFVLFYFVLRQVFNSPDRLFFFFFF